MLIALQQQMLQLGAMVDQAHGGNEVTAGLINQFGMQTPNSAAYAFAPSSENSEEASITRNARKRVADSTSPT